MVCMVLISIPRSTAELNVLLPGLIHRIHPVGKVLRRPAGLSRWGELPSPAAVSAQGTAVPDFRLACSPNVD